MWDIMPERASTFAHEVDSVIELITYIVGAWAIVAYLIFFAFMVMFRKKEGKRSQFITGATGKQMAWVLVPLILVVACDLGIDLYNHGFWKKIRIDMPEVEETVHVQARQWAWVFTYAGPDGQFNTGDEIITYNTMHVKENVKYKFVLSSNDVLHSFSIPVFRLKQDAVPGRLYQGWFEANKKGTYDIQCAEICGVGHTVMAARVIVHSASDYENALQAAAKNMPVEEANSFRTELAAAFNTKEN